MGNKSKTTWIDVEIRVTTAAAIMVNDGKRDAWIPRSQILDYEDEITTGMHTKIEIAEWLALEKGLI